MNPLCSEVNSRFQIIHDVASHRSSMKTILIALSIRAALARKIAAAYVRSNRAAECGSVYKYTVREMRITQPHKTVYRSVRVESRAGQDDQPGFIPFFFGQFEIRINKNNRRGCSIVRWKIPRYQQGRRLRDGKRNDCVHEQTLCKQC